LRVRVHRRTDVTALGVRDDKRSSIAKNRDGPLQHGEAGASVRLEERNLRFDESNLTGEGLDADLGESLQTFGGTWQSPRVEKRGMRVDTDAQPPPVRDRGPETMPPTVTHDCCAG
jgi:hypothetical protein